MSEKPIVGLDLASADPDKVLFTWRLPDGNLSVIPPDGLFHRYDAIDAERGEDGVWQVKP